MPRVTKSVTAKAKHKKVLSATKGHYGARSRLYLELQSNLILNLFNMHLEIEKIEKENLEHYGLQELMLGSRALGVSYSVLINGLKK
jgi:large subunit ribosomal protein L20